MTVRLVAALVGALVTAFVMLLAAAPAGADWPQFRGPGGRGIGEGVRLPTTWSETDAIAWRVELPGRGVSSPIVVSERVIVTANTGFRRDRLHVLCFDARTGARLWERQFWATGRTMCHPKTCMAAPTPASDGQRIFASFSTNDIFCLDLQGNLLWLRGLTADYPSATSSIGMASSPIFVERGGGDRTGHRGIVVVQVENQSDSFAAGLDAETGVNVWKIRRGSNPSWSTPRLRQGRNGGDETLVLESWDAISGHDPRTGTERWRHEAKCSCIPSPIDTGDLLLVPIGGLTALRPRPSTTSPEVVWQSGRLGPSMATPVTDGTAVYVLTNAGIIVCADAQSGEIRWRLRLKGPFSSSPLIAGGHLYCINEKGLAQVVRLGKDRQKDAKGELVGASSFGEPILATPAIAAGGLFVRSDRHLWKVARSPQPAERIPPPGS